jgi:hypothetical protein
LIPLGQITVGQLVSQKLRSSKRAKTRKLYLRMRIGGDEPAG